MWEERFLLHPPTPCPEKASAFLSAIRLQPNLKRISSPVPSLQSQISRQIVAQNTLIGYIASLWGRRPQRPLGARSGICPISPGLVETYIVWSDRPLFLWYSPGKTETVQLVVREEATDKEVWRQTVNLAQQKVFYGGEKSLEPGKLYQWQLLGRDNLNVTLPSTFQIMAAGDRYIQRIATTYLFIYGYSVAIMTSDALITAIACFPS
ncbi:MAG: DUF928 domain-containing protein [Nostoc sp. S4]|nr:DUF928 domain-containing protein [Nostoc sp. S4]